MLFGWFVLLPMFNSAQLLNIHNYVKSLGPFSTIFSFSSSHQISAIVLVINFHLFIKKIVFLSLHLGGGKAEKLFDSQ